MSDTFFQKKTLYGAITGLLIGLIFVVCPVFVSATVAQPKTLPYTYNGNTYPLAFGSGNKWLYCDEPCLSWVHADGMYVLKDYSLSPNHFCYFNCVGGVCPENPTACNDGMSYFTLDGWSNCFSDMKSTQDVKERGGYEYGTARCNAGTVADQEVVRTANIEPGYVCGIDHCSYCETSEDCVGAGCIYEYNSWFARWECHQEYVPYIPGCGTGFQESCYGCYNQENCENAIPVGVCEWVDRGYGIACYPTEEVPGEAVWEAPELENCDGLSGVEKWLCEIKNWVAGLFMPTQEKVNNLKMTIDNFKAKFPFNYAGSLSAFFNTIKTSLDTPKDIPVEVFGNSGNLNFDFLEATGTIGGTSETIKNILFDFSTALIVIGFLFWIISFIKRLF